MCCGECCPLPARAAPGADEMRGRWACPWPAAIARLAVALLAALIPARAAWATDWTVDAENSALGIAVAQGSDSITGRFQRFTAEIRFDPADLANCRVVVTVDPASLDTGSRDRDELVPTEPWFDTPHFPQARFEATRFVALGADRYEAQGTLAIKGIARPVTLPFTLVIDDDTARVHGALTLDRTDFSLGEGDFADPSLIGHEVTVTVELTAHRAP